jgi:steroid delta-isomerase-like uncharacterized protein
MSAQENARLARELYDAFGRMDFDRCLAMATDDVEVLLVPADQTFTGKEGLRQFMQVWKTATPDGVVTVVNQIASDDGVVNECTYHATHTGPLMSPAGEIPASGKTLDLRFCEVWTVRGGKLASIHNYQDFATLLRQIGVMPS